MGTEKREAPETQRNHLCRYYDVCLEKAAMKNLPELPCRGCQYENDQGGREKFQNYLDGCWTLLRVLFYPCNKKPEENREQRLLLFDYPPPVDGESETDESEKRARKSSEE